MAEKKEIQVSIEQLARAFEADRAKLENLERNLQQMQAIIIEINAAIGTVDTIAKTKEGEKSLVPFGGGYYLEVTLGKSTTVKRMIASKILLDTKAADAKKDLENKRDELRNNFEAAVADRNKLAQNVNNLSKVISTMQNASARKAKK